MTRESFSVASFRLLTWSFRLLQGSTAGRVLLRDLVFVEGANEVAVDGSDVDKDKVGATLGVVDIPGVGTFGAAPCASF